MEVIYQQILQKAQRLSRNEFTTDFLPWKTGTLEQKHPRSLSCCADRRSATGRPAPNNSHIKNHDAAPPGIALQAITPIRNKKSSSISTFASPAVPKNP